MTIALEVRNLEKRFPKVHAVRGISFQVTRGTCFGLLGPNGAGKSTTIEMIEGITRPTAGEILFNGLPIGPEFRQRMGIQFQETSLPEYLQVHEVLTLFSRLYRKTVPMAEIIELCQLSAFLKQDVHTLSGGQRQRVLLGIALVNDPEILFLDEPTTGLDPQARQNFWMLINSIKKKQKTIVMTTHYMEEAHALCDEIAIMSSGKIIAQGDPDSLLEKHFKGMLIEISDQFQTEATRKKIVELGGLQTDAGWIFRTSNVEQTIRSCIEAQLRLDHLSVRSQTLEELFLSVTSGHSTEGVQP